MNKIYSLLALICVSSLSQAATISRDFSGNDCSGFFGTGFDSCTIFVNSAGQRIELSPVIAKYDIEEGSVVTNSLFPSVDGSEFTLTGTNTSAGTWSYNPDVGDPGVRYWATKAGPNFTLTWEVDDSAVLLGGACDVADVYTFACLDIAQVVSSAGWLSPDGKNLSHITFYDTGIVPLPAAAWLFITGLFGFIGVARRRK